MLTLSHVALHVEYSLCGSHASAEKCRNIPSQ